MIVRLGHRLFHIRNALFPLLYPVLLLPSGPIIRDRSVAIAIGVVLAVSGQVVRLATIGLQYIVRGGRHSRIYAGALVTEGIFAHCRNPMYVGNILILAGLTFIADSLLFVLIGLPLFAFFYYAIVRAEEDFLTGRFGEEYVAYAQSVPRFVPKLDGLGRTFRESRFHWYRALRKEYGSTAAWTIGAVLILVKDALRSPTGHSGARLPILIAMGVLLVVAWAFVRVFKKSGRLDRD